MGIGRVDIKVTSAIKKKIASKMMKEDRFCKKRCEWYKIGFNSDTKDAIDLAVALQEMSFVPVDF